MTYLGDQIVGRLSAGVLSAVLVVLAGGLMAAAIQQIRRQALYQTITEKRFE